MNESFTTVRMRGHRATGHAPQSLDNRGLSRTILAQDERQGLEELNFLLVKGREGADASEGEFVDAGHVISKSSHNLLMSVILKITHTNGSASQNDFADFLSDF